MNTGRRVVETEHHGSCYQTLTTTYGYLADEQLRVALARIRWILKHKRYEWDGLKQQTAETSAKKANPATGSRLLELGHRTDIDERVNCPEARALGKRVCR